MPIASHRLHWRDLSQIIQDDRIIQISSVQDEIDAGQLLKDSRR